jgi:septum formation protein
MFSAEKKVILASASPRRRQFFTDLGISFGILVSGLDEKHIPGEQPHDYVARNATQKALAATQLCSPMEREGVVVGADTIVVSPEGYILEKPIDVDDACRMLRMLSARKHTVMSAFALVDASTLRVLHSQVVHTAVSFRRLEEAEIRAYVATGEPLDKAGAYGIQGKAAVFVDSVEGSYTNVVGLPLCELVDALKTHVGLKLFLHRT